MASVNELNVPVSITKYYWSDIRITVFLERINDDLDEGMDQVFPVSLFFRLKIKVNLKYLEELILIDWSYKHEPNSM